MKNFLLLAIITLTITSCASKKNSDLAYQPKENPAREGANLLNIFTPRKATTEKCPVVIFIHGGYWDEGNKDIYGFLGRNFAKNDVVTVIPNYRLSPNVSFDGMANDVVKAIQWTEENISEYGGDIEQIYLMGHSAGAHLISLVATNSKYKVYKSAVKGLILNDAAGLDMKSYLEEFPPTSDHNYNITWTSNPEIWKEASPVYFVDENTPQILIYVGKKTYPSIKSQNLTFLKSLQNYQPDVSIHYLDKKHVPMMTQYIFPWVDRYDEILKFMGR